MLVLGTYKSGDVSLELIWYIVQPEAKMVKNKIPYNVRFIIVPYVYLSLITTAILKRKLKISTGICNVKL